MSRRRRSTEAAGPTRRARTPYEASVREQMVAALTAPHARAMYRKLPGRAMTGRSRDYLECAYLAWQLVMPIFGSHRKLQTNLGDPVIWHWFCDALAQAQPDVPGIRRLKDQPPMRYHHFRWAASTWLASVLDELMEAFRDEAAGLAAALGQCAAAESDTQRPARSNATKWDGHVIAPLYSRKQRIDRQTGEITYSRGEDDVDDFLTGTGEWKHGREFTYGLTLGTGQPWTQVVVDFDWVPRHGKEVETSVKRIIETGRRLPGMRTVLYDGALSGAHIGPLAGDHGLVVISPTTPEKAGKPAQPAKPGKAGKPSVPAVPKSGFLRTFEHTDADGSTCSHALYYKGSRVVERGELAADGTVLDTDLEYVGPIRRVNDAELDRRRAELEGDPSDRRGRRGDQPTWAFRWYAEYKLHCGGRTHRVLESTLSRPGDKINRSENVRQVPSTTDLYLGLYPHRSSIEGFNSWVDRQLLLRRARCKGVTRQTLEQLAVLSLYNALVWRANAAALAPPGTAAA